MSKEGTNGRNGGVQGPAPRYVEVQRGEKTHLDIIK